MKRFTSWLLTGAAILGVSAMAWAGAVGDFGQPHLVTLPVAKTQHNSSYPNGRDSVSFWLETLVAAASKPAAVPYDSACVSDTLATINLENNAAFAASRSGGLDFHTTTSNVIDSVWVGTLVLNFDPATSTLSSTDSIFVWTDVSLDGVNFISQGAQPSLGTHGGVLRASAISGGTVKGGGACVVVARRLMSSTLTVPTGMVANSLVCNMFGAKAVRFRLSQGVTKPKLKIASATWTFVSTSPDRNR